MKIIDNNDVTFVEGAFPSHLETYYEHYLECYHRCLLLESNLAYLEATTGHSCFPVIIGRRPNTALSNTPSFQGKENVSHITNSSPLVSSEEDYLCSDCVPAYSALLNSRISFSCHHLMLPAPLSRRQLLDHARSTPHIILTITQAK